MLLWKDATTYSRGETDRNPRVWTANVGRLKMTVHRHIHYPKNVWLLSCDPLFDCHQLESPEELMAKRQSAELIAGQLHKALADIG